MVRARDGIRVRIRVRVRIRIRVRVRVSRRRRAPVEDGVEEGVQMAS